MENFKESGPVTATCFWTVTPFWQVAGGAFAGNPVRIECGDRSALLELVCRQYGATSSVDDVSPSQGNMIVTMRANGDVLPVKLMCVPSFAEMLFPGTGD